MRWYKGEIRKKEVLWNVYSCMCVCVYLRNIHIPCAIEREWTVYIRNKWNLKLEKKNCNCKIGELQNLPKSRQNSGFKGIHP